jgi:membrane protease YdiL (CAAX protease family)
MADEFDAETVIARTGPQCASCDAPVGTNDRFCRKCGAILVANEGPDTVDKKWDAVRQFILFFIIEAIICATSFIKALSTLGWMITTDASLAVVAVVFVSLNWQACKPLFRWNNFSLAHLALYCICAIAAACLINFSADWINKNLFSKGISYYAFFARYRYAIALTIFFVSVMPAIFEELAFRVFLIEKLLVVTEKKQAALISGFMFAIMHMSFISLFWLLPFGMLLGYIRIKQNTMWYGSCIHFCFNLTACVIDIAHFR